MTTSKNTKMLLIGLIVLGGLLIFSTGCSGLKPFPTKELIEYDAKNKVCGLYNIVDPETLKVEYVKDIPCVDVFGFRAKDVPNVMNWAQDAQEYVRNHCK